MRFPVNLKEPTCPITDKVVIRNSPAINGSSNSVRVRIANPAIPPPSAREPVSPMKIRAGEVLNQRKPKLAPAVAAATMARSSGFCVL